MILAVFQCVSEYLTLGPYNLYFYFLVYILKMWLKLSIYIIFIPDERKLTQMEWMECKLTMDTYIIKYPLSRGLNLPVCISRTHWHEIK